ncbi:MAG TPA: DNA polymerase IV [Anaerolineales bacterium]|nr:DNA polymerase IV [Anaerolineales bacterium]HMX74063.1 DNA polymerase IV [Anaerolineales bacterium]HMZ43055.1 DNA polymerase IV [Anaerolineales bacterium]HNA54531.1 DNA polymerase IV [Anaerolineales bacterium]HNC88209.1 DNA polymerase IV [Anaerolineales bacterium]
MPRTILHLDLDAFYCSVEETQNPALRGKPFAVGGKPDERGVVASCSYAARALGIRSAMPMSRAVRLCGNLIIIPGRHKLYGEYSEKVMDKLRNLTPLLEQISIDEAFLDISDIRESPARIALDLQAGIKNELHLPSSIGIASNKLVAKIATEVGKKSSKKKNEPPFGLTIVPAGEEAAFLAPLPADMLWGVGPKTSARLTELGIRTIGDIANWPEKDLVHLFGENGRDLWRHAHGIDNRPIVTEYETKSISQETTFNVDVRDDKTLEKTLREQAKEVARQLRKNDLAGKTVKIKIRWPDFTTLTRQVTLPTATDSEDDIIKAALKLLQAIRKPNQAVRLLGVGVSGIGAPVRQLSLWDAGSEKSRKLQEVVDQLQEKYGRNVIHRGE